MRIQGDRTWNRVEKTVMAARTTVTTSWMSTKGLMKTFFSGKIISTSAMGTSVKDLTTMLRCAMSCKKATEAVMCQVSTQEVMHAV